MRPVDKPGPGSVALGPHCGGSCLVLGPGPPAHLCASTLSAWPRPWCAGPLTGRGAVLCIPRHRAATLTLTS